MRIYQPFAFLGSCWTYRSLIGRLAWRRIEVRYRGSILGFLWTVINPLLLLCVYTFVFSFVFRSRWGAGVGNEAEFALFLFSGMILYVVFAQCVNEAPGLILANRAFVKQHLFPVEVLPWVSLLAALFDLAVSMLILVAFHLVVLGILPVTAWYMPVVIVPILLLTLGVSWFLTALGVYLRDISQIVGVLTTALLFMSPIFYPVSRIPESMRDYYLLNPFARILQMSKDVFFRGEMPDWGLLALISAGAWMVAWSGYAWFMRTKGGFADVT